MSSLYDWSATPASNTTVDGININTGCPAGNVDNALRSIMAIVRNTFHADLETFLAGSAPLAIENGGTGSATGVFVPSGAVFHFAMTTAPTGYLKCNGAAVSRATYADLFAAIGTTFGVGNGSTTFNLPDLRGEFLRGYDDGRLVDSGRVFGSYQADELEAHTHTYTANTALTEPGGGSGPVQSDEKGSYNTGSTGGTETRPRNVALLACIKI